MEALTQEARTNSQVELLYRHPTYLSERSDNSKAYRLSYGFGFKWEYDVYSFGLILLEIGLWEPIEIYHKRKYTHFEFREKVLSRCSPLLGPRVGVKYRRAVDACLTGSLTSTAEGVPLTGLNSYWLMVLKELCGCSA